MQVLKDGGNAFDAAVTVAAVLAVVEPYSSGIGGGGFWLLHRVSDGKQVMLDGRERAPLAAHRDMYLDEQGKVIEGASIDGVLSAGIPGQVAAMVHLQENYGRLPMPRLLAPAINYAREGFPVDRIYSRLAQFRLKPLNDSADSKRILLDNGRLPPPGFWLRQPELARTLETIAAHGNDGFYTGEMAQRLIRGVREAGGIWVLEDLQQYQVIEREPIQFEWQGMQITSANLPSSGGIVLAQIFNILSQYEWDGMSDLDQRHLLIEAMRRAYRDRAEFLGDSDIVKVDIAELTSTAHAGKLASDIDRKQATPSAFLPAVSVKETEGNDTTHYSIIDTEGNRVAATLSINYPFGSGFIVPGTGVLLNDEMDDFSIRPGTPNAYGLVGNEANAIAPGKRMLSSMSPTFVETDDKLAIVGSPGGSRIITMVMHAILGLKQGLNADAIVETPRIHHQYLPDRVQIEPNALTATQEIDLQDRGHELQVQNSTWGNMQIVIMHRASKKLEAASDPRGIGRAKVE